MPAPYNRPIEFHSPTTHLLSAWQCLAASDPARLADNLDRISQQALRAGDIIRHLRNFVRRGHVDPMPLDLNAVIRSACELMSPKARRSGIDLKMSPDPRLPSVTGTVISGVQCRRPAGRL